MGIDILECEPPVELGFPYVIRHAAPLSIMVKVSNKEILFQQIFST